MSTSRTKMNENNATIFHSYPCSFPSVFFNQGLFS